MRARVAGTVKKDSVAGPATQSEVEVLELDGTTTSETHMDVGQPQLGTVAEMGMVEGLTIHLDAETLNGTESGTETVGGT